jgi:lipoate-protein ligase A
MDFYHSFGLNASYAADVVSDVQILGSRTAFCFAGKEAFDILINGRKIGGNAQRRQKNSIFQHGSIPIINQAKIGLEYMSERLRGCAEASTSLQECGVFSDVNTLNFKLIESFSRNLSVNLKPSQISEDEQQIFQRLLTLKYSTENWNFRGELHDHSA